MAAKKQFDSGLNDGRCEWNADGERCKYPGSCAHGMLGAGPWYCSWHISSLDPHTKSDVVKSSQTYEPETSRSRLEAHYSEARKYCQSIGMLRRSEETQDEFFKRRMEWIRDRLGGFSVRSLDGKTIPI